LKIKNLHKELYLEYDEKLISKIEQITLDHYPNEFGGFLVGYYSDDLKTLVLTDLLTPNEYKSYRTLFERGTKGIAEKLIELFNLEEKRYYVGEWHSHPNASSRFSSVDLNAMKNIAKSESVRIENPILLIVSISSQKLMDYSFYLFDNNKLLEYGKN
jgi:integrative and conjugative element protein (TIGR02256 family)